MKFSIIVPIYNVEKYLDRCLKSIFLQSYKDYEVLMISDKSTDNSDSIVKEYAKKDRRFKRIYEENTGLARAKNIGIDNAKGDYVLFVDGDDFIEKDLLSKLSKEILDNEVVRFQIQEVYDDKVIKYEEKPFNTCNGIEAFKRICSYHFIEPSWAYVYSLKFWKENKFKFMNGCVAEDFGLTPLIINKCNKIKSISYIGYNYVQRANSIMSENDYSKKIDKMNNMIKQAKFLYKNIDENEYFYRFINNSLITYVTSLKYKDYKKYKKDLKEFDLFKYMEDDSLKRKIKKFVFKSSPYIYKKYIERFIW